MKYIYEILAYTDRYGQCRTRISWTDEHGNDKYTYSMPYSSHVDAMNDTSLLISMIEAGIIQDSIVYPAPEDIVDSIKQSLIK